MQARLAVAVNDGVGKWVPGTVLSVHSSDMKFNWGDEACFLLIEVKDFDERKIPDVQARKVGIHIDKFISPETVKKYEENKPHYFDRYIKDQATLGVKKAGRKWAPLFMAGGKGSDFTKVVAGQTTGLFFTTPEKQWVKEIDPFEEPEGIPRRV